MLWSWPLFPLVHTAAATERESHPAHIDIRCLPQQLFVMFLRGSKGSQGSGFEHRSTRGFGHVKN